MIVFDVVEGEAQFKFFHPSLFTFTAHIWHFRLDHLIRFQKTQWCQSLIKVEIWRTLGAALVGSSKHCTTTEGSTVQPQCPCCLCWKRGCYSLCNAGDNDFFPPELYWIVGSLWKDFDKERAYHNLKWIQQHRQHNGWCRPSPRGLPTLCEDKYKHDEPNES